MRNTWMRSEHKKEEEKEKKKKQEEDDTGGGGLLLVGAAGGFDREAGQCGGPAEHVGTVWSLLDKLRCSLNKCSNRKHTIIHHD